MRASARARRSGQPSAAFGAIAGLLLTAPLLRCGDSIGRGRQSLGAGLLGRARLGSRGGDEGHLCHRHRRERQRAHRTRADDHGRRHRACRRQRHFARRVAGRRWRLARTQLRAPLSDATWRIWRANVPVETGKHVLTVRCVDGLGSPQLTAVAPPHPSGASGLYRKAITI
jgi:hypothetical protein